MFFLFKHIIKKLYLILLIKTLIYETEKLLGLFDYHR